MPQNSSSSFLNSRLLGDIVAAVVAAIAAALLAGTGYLIHRCLTADRSDLSIQAQGFEQIVPIVPPQPKYRRNTVYCEAVRYDLIISHNQKGQKPIRLTQISLETEYMDLDDQTKAQLVCKLDASKTLGFGIVKLREYVFDMDGENIQGSYLKNRQDHPVKVDPNNVFRSTLGSEGVTIKPEGDDSFFQPVVALQALSPGLYKVRTHIYYNIGGNKQKEEVMSWVYVVMQ